MDLIQYAIALAPLAQAITAIYLVVIVKRYLKSH